MSKHKTPSPTPQAGPPEAAPIPATKAPRSKAKASKKASPIHTKRVRAKRDPNRDEKGRLLPGHAVGSDTRWPEGKSGNPSGRSTEVQSAQAEFERILSEVALEHVEVKVGDEVRVMSRMRMMLTRLAEVGSGESGNMVNANQEFFNRLVGKAKQPLEHSGLGNVYIVDTVEDVPDPRNPTPPAAEQ